ncbi:MAG: KEOPS complex subunit Pcc1 [Halanaeroarchaeum sp.]
MHRTTLALSYDDIDRARIVERSVAVEAGDIAGDRSRATVERDGDTVTIEIEATDLVALRAGQNTWLSLVQVAEAVDSQAVGRSPSSS